MANNIIQKINNGLKYTDKLSDNKNTILGNIFISSTRNQNDNYSKIWGDLDNSIQQEVKVLKKKLEIEGDVSNFYVDLQNNRHPSLVGLTVEQFLSKDQKQINLTFLELLLTLYNKEIESLKAKSNDGKRRVRSSYTGRKKKKSKSIRKKKKSSRKNKY